MCIRDRLYLGDLDVVVLVNIGAVLDGELLAPLDLERSGLLGRELLAVEAHRVGRPGALLQHLVVNGEQVA